MSPIYMLRDAYLLKEHNTHRDNIWLQDNNNLMVIYVSDLACYMKIMCENQHFTFALKIKSSKLALLGSYSVQ